MAEPQFYEVLMGNRMIGSVENCTETFKLQVEFKLVIPMSSRPETMLTLNNVTTGIGCDIY